MRGRALHQNGSFGQTESTLLVPLLQSGDGLWLAVRDLTIIAESLAHHRAEGLWELE